MSLYSNMNLLRLMAERLHAGKHSKADIKYLAQVLNDIVNGRDAHDAFSIGIKQKGLKRTDYRKHLNIVRAFHMIVGAMETTQFEIMPDGKDTETDKTVTVKGMKLKEAVYTAADYFKINRGSLLRYWNHPAYQWYKTMVYSPNLCELY